MSRPSDDTRDRRLLRDFDENAALVRDFVVGRFGESAAEAIERRAREIYAAALPQVPHIPGPRARMLNVFLRITAQEVAVYHAVLERDGDAAQAWEICHEAIRRRVATVPRWKRWMMQRLMHSGFVRRIMRRREARNERGRFGEFEIRYLTGDGGDFDTGVDYTACGNLELARRLGATEFAPYVCMSDIPLSDGLGWGLQRTQTLADGCSHCDFRFKRGAPTRVSSKTPEVQRTVERIAQQSGAMG